MAGAEKIDHPLTTTDQRVKYLLGYDQIAAQVEAFKIRDYARKFPHMHAWYVEQGRFGEGEVL